MMIDCELAVVCRVDSQSSWTWCHEAASGVN